MLLYDVTSGPDKIHLYIVQIICKDTQEERNTLDDFQKYLFVFKLISIGLSNTVPVVTGPFYQLIFFLTP